MTNRCSCFLPTSLGLALALAAASPVLYGAERAPGTPEATSPAQALQTLADEEWEWRLAQFPERATQLGDHRYDDRLTDLSPAAIAGRRAHHRVLLERVRAIDTAGLDVEQRITRDILLFGAEQSVRLDTLLEAPVAGHDAPFSSSDSPLDVNQMAGPQFDLPQLLRTTPFKDEHDYRNYLARLAALPTQLAQLQAQLESGRAAGWMPPRVALARLPDQFAPLLATDLATHPLFAPFTHFPDSIDAAQRAALTSSAEASLHAHVIPALQGLRDYLARVWVPAATATLAATALPQGAEYYQLSLERYNTTRLTPAEIHALGLAEVARLDGEMRAVMKEAGFTGTLSGFRTFLRTDKRFQFATAEEELAAFRDIAKRVDPQLPGLFAELPRLPYGIRAMSPEEGNNAPHYIRGAIDGSRAGYFEANVNSLAAWPRWTMDALFLHEAVPGHHLQIARAQELQTLPRLRRAYTNSGYTEGWGLYAEGLGRDLGLYADPYARFGRLTLEAHRASRLVVDTGLHSMGWTRQQAIDYLVEHAQLEQGFAEAEIDRYLVWPGQATAYKVGELRILAARARAQAALGARFDLRRFHNAVIDHGALPLTLLDQVVDQWIAAQR